MGERAERKVHHHAAVVEEFLKFAHGGRHILADEIRVPAQVSRVHRAERKTGGEPKS